jgi:predicted RNA-binding Zn ribbon-like protein
MRYAAEMVVEVQAMPLVTLVHLVNGWGTVPRKEAAERETPHLANFPGSLTAADAGMSDADLRRVADKLFPVFVASGAADRASRVTDLLAGAAVRPALVSHGGHIQPSWLVKRQRDALLAAAAISLHAQLAEHRCDRLGTCGADHCADVYVDASPAGHRRFCSVTCQNRARVAVFRRRKSAAKG